jgi:beta-glucosidase
MMIGCVELLGRMTLEEKLAQIVGFWEKEDGEAVAPLQGAFGGVTKLDEFVRHGLGHLTRPYGTRPIHPVERASWLWAFQRGLVTGTRLGIPAIVHEECLTGLSAWKAATFPTPLAWGAAFDADLVAEMGEAIGGSMRALGIHQGLAPVLDVVRDPRWGRVDECIAEDPYLVGTIGTSYVRGLQSKGVHATLKHFVGYSASSAGRNFGPVHAGPRELADVLLIPFEMAILDGGACSVMHSYTEIDGVPVAADHSSAHGASPPRLGIRGEPSSPTISVSRSSTCCTGWRATWVTPRRRRWRRASTSSCRRVTRTRPHFLISYGRGTVDEALIDRAVLRVLRQKLEPWVARCNLRR